MNKSLLIPNLKETSDQDIVKLSPQHLAPLGPRIGALMPQCVPTPFAEPEVMTVILKSIPASPTEPFTDTTPTASLRQSYQRWQLLLKSVMLGRVDVENVALASQEADNFGRTLVQARSHKRHLGVLRCRGIPALNLQGKDSRLVGGLDERALVWAAPRMTDADWGTLAGMIHGAEERLSVDLLHAWRGMLIAKGLWRGDGLGPAWMRGVDRMLGDHQPAQTWEQLQANVRLAGPTRLEFMTAANEPCLLDVFLPVWSPGWADGFAGVFRLQPVSVEGGIDLVEPATGRVGRSVLLASGRNSSPDLSSSAARLEVRNEDVLLSGVGTIVMRDPSVQGDHWWLQDRDGVVGYRTAVYDPLLRAALQVHSLVPGGLTEADIDRCPTFFPDALRLARGLMYAPPGMSGVEYITLKERHRSLVQQWSLPLYGLQISAKLVPPGPKETWVLALSDAPSAPCFVERLAHATGIYEVAEIRSLGALLWELFTREVEVKPGSGSLNRTDGVSKVASQAQDKAPRIIFNTDLLASVGSVLAGGGTDIADVYRKRVQQRRATAQRFLMTWRGMQDASSKGSLLGGLAADAFLGWAFAGQSPLAEWGVTARVQGGSIAVTKDLQVPVYLDPYPRKV